jgi:hypothetical protein
MKLVIIALVFLVNPYWFNLQLGVAIGVTDTLTSSSPQPIKLCFIQRLDNSFELKLTYIPIYSRLPGWWFWINALLFLLRDTVPMTSGCFGTPLLSAAPFW